MFPRTIHSHFPSSDTLQNTNVWDSTGKLAVPGSFDPLLTSGSGATYFSSIPQTSDQTLSAGQTLATPPLGYDNVSYTRQYLAARLSVSNTAFSHTYATYDTWFAAGNPMKPDGQHPEDHLLIVPVVSQAVKNKQGNVTVMAFALFFVDQPYLSVGGPAGNGIALGRFLSLTIPSASGGTCAGGGGKTPPRLLQ